MKRTVSTIILILISVFACYGQNATSSGYYQVRPTEWPMGVHFEWIPFFGEHLVNGKDLTIVLHLEPSKANRLSELIRGLEGDKHFHPIPGRVEGIASKSTSTYLSITKRLDKPFIYQSDQERQECLSMFYDEICLAIPLVDKYL